jgi:hypothetical protein
MECLIYSSATLYFFRNNWLLNWYISRCATSEVIARYEFETRLQNWVATRNGIKNNSGKQGCQNCASDLQGHDILWWIKTIHCNHKKNITTDRNWIQIVLQILDHNVRIRRRITTLSTPEIVWATVARYYGFPVLLLLYVSARHKNARNRLNQGGSALLISGVDIA